jgi:hypothetical protein
MWKYQRILLAIAGEDIFKRLRISCGCREPGKVNKLPQTLKFYVNFLIKPPVASVL